MVETFNCPNCRASLDYDVDRHSLTTKCEYCNSTVIVPESLRGGLPKATESEQALEMAQAAQLVQEGRKIEAVKLIRKTFGVGLKEAKDMVDALERHEVIRLGEATFEVPAGSGTAIANTRSMGKIVGCFVVIIIGLVVIGVAVPLLGSGLAIFGIFEAERRLSPNEEKLTPVLSPTPGFAEVSLQFGGSEGTGPGAFDDTRHIGVDGEGRIYTGDYQGGRIQVFAADGAFLDLWHTANDLPMTGMAVDRTGVLYVVQGREIHRYDGRSGESLGTLTVPGQNRPELIALGPDSSLVATNDDGLIRFDRQGQVTLDAAEALKQLPDNSIFIRAIAADGSGNIYVLAKDTIYQFDASGSLVDQIGSVGEAIDQFDSSPSSLVIDNQNRLYADSGNIMVFEEGGRYLDSIDFRGVAFAMVFNIQNELLVMDRNGNQVLKYVLNQ